MDPQQEARGEEEVQVQQVDTEPKPNDKKGDNEGNDEGNDKEVDEGGQNTSTGGRDLQEGEKEEGQTGEGQKGEHVVVGVFDPESTQTAIKEAEEAETKARRIQRFERLGYASGSMALAIKLLVADVFFTKRIIKKRMWGSRRMRRNSMTQSRMFGEGAGGHFALAVSITLKVYMLIMFVMAVVSLLVAFFPGLELKARALSVSSTPKSMSLQSGTRKNAFFEQYISLCLPMLIWSGVFLLGVWVSVTTLETKLFFNRMLGRVSPAAREPPSAADNNDSNDGSGAAQVDAPWIRYMVLHCLLGTTIAVFFKYSLYLSFDRDLQLLKTFKECPSTASFMTLWNFRDW